MTETLPTWYPKLCVNPSGVTCTKNQMFWKNGYRHTINLQTKNAHKAICCVLLNKNNSKAITRYKSTTKYWPPMWPNFQYWTLKPYVTTPPDVALSRIDCRKSNNIQSKIAARPICCVLPNNNKQNPFINYFRMPIKVNSLQLTADNQ